MQGNQVCGRRGVVLTASVRRFLRLFLFLLPLQTLILYACSEEDCQAKWDATHESGSSAIAKVINELKGFYVKSGVWKVFQRFSLLDEAARTEVPFCLVCSGQLIATRVDLFPEQYTSKLSELQDNAEPMPFELVRSVPGLLAARREALNFWPSFVASTARVCFQSCCGTGAVEWRQPLGSV